MGAHILAGAAVIGLAMTPLAVTRLSEWRAERAVLARITPPVQAEMDAAMALFAAETRTRFAEAHLAWVSETDRWDTPHYHTEPVTKRHESERSTVLHLVDTQTHSAVTATRPMLPAVPAVRAGELRQARFYDIGRAG